MSDLGGEFRLTRPREAAARFLSRAAGPTPAARLRSVTVAPVLRALGRPASDAFRGFVPDPGRRNALLGRPEASRTLVILFTPRSGSSRLTEVLTQASRLGRPVEALNPAFLPAMARAVGARSAEEYVALLRRAHNRGGTMGFEATVRHALDAFGTADRFAAVVRPDLLVWLLREDIVAQAVSISRMAQTRLHHALPDVAPEALARADAAFAYRPLDVATRLAQLRRLEVATERFLRDLGHAPLRLSYERSLACPPRDLAARIAGALGVELPVDVAFALTHARLGTDKNLAFAHRFREEHRDLVARVERARAPLIEALE